MNWIGVIMVLLWLWPETGFDIMYLNLFPSGDGWTFSLKMEFFRAGWEFCKNVGIWQPCGAPSSDLSIRQESFCWQYYIDPEFEGTTGSAPPSCTCTEHRSPQQHRPGSSVCTPRDCAKILAAPFSHASPEKAGRGVLVFAANAASVG